MALEITVGGVVLYLFFCLLYYVFRDDEKEEDTAATDTAPTNTIGRASRLARGLAPRASRLARVGISIGSVMMNQVQILSLIFANIIWSAELPPALIKTLNFVGNLLSLNLSDFISSPECVAELDPLARWSIALALPFFLALLFLVWFVLARNRRRCCTRRR